MVKCMLSAAAVAGVSPDLGFGLAESRVLTVEATPIECDI